MLKTILLALVGALVGAQASNSSSTASIGVVKYFADAGCTQPGGGPPGLLANPFQAPIGQCVPLLSNGFSINIQSCDAQARVQTYPQGCGGPAGAVFATPVGQCASQYGIFSVATCL